MLEPASFWDVMLHRGTVTKEIPIPDLGWLLPYPSCRINDESAPDHVGVVLSSNPTRTKLTLTFPKDHMIDVFCEGRSLMSEAERQAMLLKMKEKP